VGSYEYFDHAADVGIRVRGSSLPDLFLTGARALMAWIGSAPARDESFKESVSVEAESLEDLYVRWLQEVLYLFQQRHAYLTGAENLEVNDGLLRATITATEWDDASAVGFQEIKAVTYHQLELSREGAEWRASVILDI
jgi:SHS2 domain-containing protein